MGLLWPAPAVTLSSSVGPFVLPYVALSGLVSAIASLGLVSVVRRAFAPLERARMEAEGVLGLAEGKRLTEDAPEEVRSLLHAMNRLLDRLDEAFLFERSIDIDTYDRHAEKLRQELTLPRMDRHPSEPDEPRVEGILASAERRPAAPRDPWAPSRQHSRAPASPARPAAASGSRRRSMWLWV